MLREEGSGGVEEEIRVTWLESNSTYVLLLTFYVVYTNLS